MKKKTVKKQHIKEQGQLTLFSKESTTGKPHITQKSITNTPFHWTVFLDGASRGNPGASGAGIYGIDHEGSVIIKEGLFLGTKTNNQAEYLALVLALYYVKNHLEKITTNKVKVTFISDSQLLIHQMNGIYKVKNPALKHMKNIIETLLIPMNYSFKHVLREYNVQADALANLGVDNKKKLSKEILQFATLYNIPL